MTNSANEEQVILNDCVLQSILKAEKILINLSKQAETENVELKPRQELSELDRATTQQNSSQSPKNSKKSEKSKKSSKKMAAAVVDEDQRVQISPPKEEKLEKSSSLDGVTMQFAVNIRNPTGEKRTIDFRLDCVNFTPTRACIDGKWKKIRPDKE